MKRLFAVLLSLIYITKVKNTYLRHKVSAEADDETVETVPDTEYYDQITSVARFLVYLLGEKETLYAAIRKAKNTLDTDVDSEVSLNAKRQSIAKTFARMNSLRSSERIIEGGGTGYRFNTDGNQTTYYCDVRRVMTINFDRNVIRAELEKLNRQAEDTSAVLDRCVVMTQVDYTPPFDMNAGFADAFEFYCSQAGA